MSFLWRRSPRWVLCLWVVLWVCVHVVVSQDSNVTQAPTPSFNDPGTTDAPTPESDDGDDEDDTDDVIATPPPTPVVTTVSTPAPTATPTAPPLPVTLAPTEPPPTVAPSQQPVVSTEEPTAGTSTTPPVSPPPTDPPSRPPSTPAPTPDDATPPPTARPTETPVTESFSGTVRDLVVTFRNVNNAQVNANALVDWEEVTKLWFQESFNGSRRRRRRLGQNVTQPTGQRRLQGSDPSRIGVSRMRTELQIIDTSATSDSLTIVYIQVMRYSSTFGELEPPSLARLPFQYAPTNDAYRTVLRDSIPGFEAVTAISVPEVLTTSAPTRSPAAAADEGFWTTTAIIGVAVGGGVALLLLLCALFYMCRSKQKSGGSTRPATNSLYSNSRYGHEGPSGYHASHQPAAQIHALGSYDDISTMEEPVIPNVITNASGDVYGDQSVATVDYDYSKAYGGGGDTSVVSSVGGTLGDNTRYTGAEPLASSRAALGASFESDEHQGRARGNVREEIIEVLAPAGKLGVVIDTPDEGAPVVHAVKDSSVIADQIQVGDKLIAVDDEDVRTMTAIKVSKLISKKSANPTRKLTIARAMVVDDD